MFKNIMAFTNFLLQLPGVGWLMERLLDMWQFSPEGACPLIRNDRFEELVTNTNQEVAIALISYGARAEHITNGSLVTTLAAIHTIKALDCKTIAFGSFYGDKKEEEIKKALLRDLAPGENVSFVGPVTSTTDECVAILHEWQKHGGVEVIVVVAEGCHARRARVVWSHFTPYFFPKAKMVFRVVDARVCEDAENPMLLQRYWRVWLIVNIILLPFFKWCPGVNWFAKHNFAQPTGER